MKQHHCISVLVVTFLAAVALGTPIKALEPLQVVVSIPPQVYFVQQLGGERVQVISMLPEGGLPHTYEPTPQQMKLLSTADMYVRIGVEFEQAWWDKIATANPTMRVIDSTAGIDFLDPAAHQYADEGEPHAEAEEHHDKEGSHDEDAHHDYHGRDPHIWLSPRLVKIQAENIYQGLIAADPDQQEMYAANKDALMSMLDSLDAEIQAQLAELGSRAFMIFHPAWAYFARDYGLEQIPIEVEGKEPSAREMTELMQLADREHISVIFVQPQTSRRSADTIAKQIGARVEFLDPLAADWLENMRDLTRILADTLSQ
jgi:zinc transport system substrate-binding protein